MSGHVKNHIKNLKRANAAASQPGAQGVSDPIRPPGPIVKIEKLLSSIGDKQVRLEMADEQLIGMAGQIEAQNAQIQAKNITIEELRAEIAELKKIAQGYEKKQ